MFWQQSADAVAHSHRGKAANSGRGMKCAAWESRCLSAGCAVPFCELPVQCWLLPDLLRDLKSWLRHSLPQEPLPPALIPGFCSATVGELLGHWVSHSCKTHHHLSVLQGSLSRHCTSQMKIVRWIPVSAHLQTFLSIRAT